MPFHRLVIIALLAFGVAQSHAATLGECEKMKLQQLKAERSAHEKGRKKPARGSRGPSKSRQSVEKLEEWLWKNCGNYAHELRSLEQGHM